MRIETLLYKDSFENNRISYLIKPYELSLSLKVDRRSHDIFGHISVDRKSKSNCHFAFSVSEVQELS